MPQVRAVRIVTWRAEFIIRVPSAFSVEDTRALAKEALKANGLDLLHATSSQIAYDCAAPGLALAE